MSSKVDVRPILKASDTGAETSYIYFDEWIDVPQCREAQISLHFDQGNSFEEINNLIADLRERGLRFVMEPVK